MCMFWYNVRMASSPQFRDSGMPLHSEVSPDSPEAEQEMVRYQALVARTVDAFGDEIKASRWLSLPNRDLSGQTPLQAAQANGYDMQVLEPILTRMEHGVDY